MKPIKCIGITDPKGWDGIIHHPVLDETDQNELEVPYYESDNNDSDEDDDYIDSIQDTESECTSSDETDTSYKRIYNKITTKLHINNMNNFKTILIDETDFIPE